MLVSLNWLKHWSKKGGVEIDVKTSELADLINARLVEVEETINIGEKYKGVKIVEVKSADKISGSDHLTKCIVFDGKDEAQVVCGAPNVKVGMLAVWLPPKTVLPETYDSEPLVLDKRKLMGVESAGMLAAMDELDLGTDHNGIVSINPDMAKPGDDFAKIFEFDDTLLDIENKSLTHRPDCFGVIGLAREIAGILEKSFKTPSWLTEPIQIELNNEVEISAEVVDAELCPRYETVVLDLPKKQPDNYLLPMQTFISRSGTRSIDRVVDITNELMLLTGQPLHAFDYDKLVKVGGTNSPKIIVRGAIEEEQLELLDGKVIKMSKGDIVITSNNKPIALAGAMGGANTAIDENTKRVVIESATFNLFSMRGTQFRHGIASEAITRFTKGQPPALTDFVIRKAIKVYEEYCGAKAVSQVADAYPKTVKNPTIRLDMAHVNDLLGSSFTIDEIITTLQNVEFKVGIKDNCLNVTAPYWRTDIHIAEDVIEEVGRINGFDNILAILPTRSFAIPDSDELGNLKSKVRQALSSFGANEVLTYNFISENLLEKVGQDPKDSYKIINSISPELQYVRQQIVPSLLEKIYQNTKAGIKEMALYEMNQVYRQELGLTKEKVPEQCDNLGLCITGDYYESKKYLMSLGKNLGIVFDIKEFKNMPKHEAYFEPKRAAFVFVDNVRVGTIGEIKKSVLSKIKISETVSAFEINMNSLINKTALTSSYKPESSYQNVERDITVRVSSDLPYIDFERLVENTLTKKDLQFSIKPVSIYQGDDKKTKNISLRISFASYDKTLKSAEIAVIMDSITSEVKKVLKGEVI